MKGIEIDRKSNTPLYKQLIQSVQALVIEGVYSEGEFLPSMNELSYELEISKDTVKKAYSILRDQGIIESAHGKGFYITKKGAYKIKILLLFDKLSSYKQVLYNSFTSWIGSKSEITIRLHNQDIELFEHFIDENLDVFDYYIITPHFPLISKIQQRAVKVLKRIPNRKLIILDYNIQGLKGNYSAVYQDFENDIINGLSQAEEALARYEKLNVVTRPGSLYSSFIVEGIKRYCSNKQISYEIIKEISPEKIVTNEAYLILNSQLDKELIEIIRIANNKGCKIGKDVGIISYNESPINEIILDGLTVFSTDFMQMGELAAKLILEKTTTKIRCNFRFVKRSTF